MNVGDRITYMDAWATTSTGQPGVVVGTMNGEPIRDDDGEVRFIPVWTERDNMREPTTILVAIDNVLGVNDA